MAQSTDEVGRTTRFVYDAEGRQLQTTFADTSITSTEYDSLGRRKATVDARGNRTTYLVDLAGRDTATVDALGHKTRFAYDAANRKISQTDALGHVTLFNYDAYDRLAETVFADGSSRKTAYDAVGRKVSETDGEGKATTFAYDAVGNLTSVKDPMGFITRYAYDANNNRISQTDANGHITTMAYDALNRLISRTYPNSDEERMGYDAEGNLSYQVNGIGDSTAYAYDARNRETHRSYAGGHQVSTTYTPDSKQDSVVDYRGLTRFTYDLRGRLKKTVHPNGQSIENKYDRQSNRTSLITSFDTTRYAYDSLNRMDSVISAAGQVTRYFYSSVGNLDSISRANGVGSKYVYDSLNRLEKLTHRNTSGTILSSYAYTLNRAGIRTQMVEADSSVVSYGYDNLYRLTSEARTGTHAYTNGFSYDSVGNRKKQIKGSDTLVYTYNNRDQLLQTSGPSGDTDYIYDAAGRQTRKVAGSDTIQYGWVDQDRMASVAGPGVSVRYAYDAEGRRVKDSTASTVNQYLIDVLLPYGQVVAKSNGGGSLVTSYAHGLDRISQAISGTTSYFLPDGQGSIRQLDNSSGSVTDTYLNSAIGEQLASTGTTANDFKYVGEQLDGNSGFYNLRARWMNPTTGRFASVDPFQGDPESPVSLHRYLYADQSPVSKSDPSGRLTLVEVSSSVSIAGTIGANLFLASSFMNAVFGTQTMGQGEDTWMRVQLQRGTEDHISSRSISWPNRRSPVTVGLFETELYNFYLEAVAEAGFPLNYLNDFGTAIARTGIWCRKTRAQGGIYTSAKKTVHQEYFPESEKDEKKAYRLDTENKGQNLLK